MSRWPHAPSHEVTHPGAYIITAATLHHAPFFASPERLTLLEETLLGLCTELGWQPQQWAVFPNHYHLVALSPQEDGASTALMKRLHGATAVAVNRLDGTSGRKVWYQRWDTRISFEKSYLARLNYVRTNPVRHGLVARAEEYPWCSAEWFAQCAERPFFDTVCSFKTDTVAVPDDFAV